MNRLWLTGILILLLTGGSFCCVRPGIKESDKLLKRNEMDAETGSGFRVGAEIRGDFNGDGILESAKVVQVREKQGNPLKGGVAEAYEIQFTGGILFPVRVGCCNLRLINEGDLDGDGTEEISTFQAPINGCAYSYTTYTFKNRRYQQLVPTFLSFTGCKEVSDKELQERVFSENNKIYYYEEDFSGEQVKLIRKEVKP